ncbi:MAG TPA: 50S ribosomal protein L24, partial [Nitratifractor sp.]|nr:50S ribosomal protein L24 [Nitratifractor sp.]
MAKKFQIKKGDTVMVIAGDDKGKTGEVLQILTKKDAVIVAGCKIAKKAVKPTEE